MSKRRVRLAVAAFVLVLGILLAVIFWPGGSGTATRAYALAPESVLTPPIRRAPAEVREAYRFAVANRGVLSYIPCFCGCGAQGHRSNVDWYLKDVRPDGTVVFDYVSLG